VARRSGQKRRKSQWRLTRTTTTVPPTTLNVSELTSGNAGRTLVRTLLDMWVAKAASGTIQQEFAVALGIFDKDFSAGFPNPSSDLNESWLFHWGGYTQPSPSSSTTGFGTSRQQVDLRSMRKYADAKDRLYLIVDNPSATLSLSYGISLRWLELLP